MNIDKVKAAEIIILSVIIIAGVIVWLSLSGKLKQDFFLDEKEKIEEADMRPTPRDAYDLAIVEAKKWRFDARLANLVSRSEVGETGRSDGWEAIFISNETDAGGKGFIVSVVDGRIVSAQEIAYSNQGAEFPEKITPIEEAIALFKEQNPGLAEEPILGIEAVYGPVEKAWYWGIKTKEGVVTVRTREAVNQQLVN